MNRTYIRDEQIVDRYLAGDLTVREAREFEKYCLENPEVLNELPIPVRLKARLARQPLEHSETGMFTAIPSSATRAALDIADEDDEPQQRQRLLHNFGLGSNRMLIIGLLVASIAALGGVIAYGSQARSLAAQLDALQQEIQSSQLQPPGGVQTHRLQLSRSRPEQATLTVGWPNPPQLLELYVDATQGAYNTFQVTIDRIDGTRIMQIRRLARDSNRELRLAVNSSAFGPGEYLLKFDGYTWRGRPQEVGWIRLDLQ